ncbi:MAG: hypothetical protein LQ348_003849 [Seirophora lacunosa]|nr:MAG: hypothetical protein LQ348_003849 [Seirophora lacunosa]
MPPCSKELPTAAFFNPQSKAAEVKYLDSLHKYLHSNEHLSGFVTAIQSLPQTWQILALYRPELTISRRGWSAAESLAKWTDTSDSGSIASGTSGSLTLPLLTVIQICQYFQYLDSKILRHSELLQCVRKGGVHGYCGGLLPAVAVAVSTNEAELVQNASKALRLAFAIGTYGDIGDLDPHSGPTNMVVRLKYAGQGEDLIRNSPGVYISAVTDPKTISLVGPAHALSQLRISTNAQGLLSQGVHIRGKVHNPENENLAAELERFCVANEDFCFPHASKLQAPCRSNSSGCRLHDQSLTREAISSILSTRCEWFQLLHNVAADLEGTGGKLHHFVNFGIGDCLSPIPFNQRGLNISKLEARFVVDDDVTKSTSVDSVAYEYPPKAVAVLGMACRYPGANNVEELWDLISSGTVTVQELPPSRVDVQKNFRVSQNQASVKPQKLYGNFVDRPDTFDHAFFDINPREAKYMDPQQRLLLETAYQAVESSGYFGRYKRGEGHDVGVFLGASFVEYMANTSSHPPTAYNSVGTLKAFLCGRISHYFGWSGPGEVIDTACSSSLVAVNRACKAIQSGECSMALAGGVNVISSLENYLDLRKAGFLSPTGQCKPFDKNADGYCRSEGVGLLFLKPYSQALQDDDHILGVICGSATNQGGLSPSITVPHSPSQVALYRKILDQAGMPPSSVSYVEAHGTGTQIGDPLEISSIREVFGSPQRRDILHIGSIKGNIGHCETAAGVAGIIKALLLLQGGPVPPMASHTTLNPKIPDLKADCMAINSRKVPWEASFRAVCVNSYGAAGSNAAAVLSQAPIKPLKKRHSVGMIVPFRLSADSKPSLIAHVADMKSYIQKANGSVAVANVAYTLAEKREHHRFQFVATSRDWSGLAQALNSHSMEITEMPSSPKRMILVFCGQVNQTVSLNPKLYQSCAIFRSHLDRCDEIVRRLGLSSIFPAISQTDPILDIKILHCCLFAQQYACAQAWIQSGLRVDAVIGHSFGELTALAVSGILSLDDALALVVGRATLIQSKWGDTPSAHLSVRCPLDIAERLIADTKDADEKIEIACLNTDESFVLGGKEGAITVAEHILQHGDSYRSVKWTRLGTSHAYHTELTESILEDLEALANSLTFRKPVIPIEVCTPEHLDVITSRRAREHTRNPVFFQRAIRRLEQRLGDCVWLEAGTDSPAFSLLKRAVSSPQNHVFQPMKLGNNEDPMQDICHVTEKLWREGVSVSYWNFTSPAELGLQQVWLSPYHFQETQHWLPFIDHTMAYLEGREMPKVTDCRPEEDRNLWLVKQITPSRADPGSNIFEINPSHPRFRAIVTGHAVLGRPLCPAGMYLEFAILAARLDVDGQSEHKALLIEKCSFESALGMSQDQVGLTLKGLKGSAAEVKWSFDVISSLKSKATKSTTHAKGNISFVSDLQIQHHQRLVARRVKELQESNSLESLQREKAYRLFSRVVDYSGMFKGIMAIKFAQTEAVAEVDVQFHKPASNERAGGLNDAVSLDVFLQVCGLLVNAHDSCPSDAAYLAVGMERISVEAMSCPQQRGTFTVYAAVDTLGSNKVKGDVYVLHDGELVVTMTGVQFAMVPLNSLAKLLDRPNKPEFLITTQVANPPQSQSGLQDGGHAAVENGHGPDNSKAAPRPEDGKLPRLGEIISSYTGLAHDQLDEDARLGTLGVDSLAGIELAEEISSAFGVQISSTSLLEGTLKALHQRLRIGTAVQSATTAASQPIKATSQMVTSTLRDGATRATARQRLAEIISSLSGHPANSIVDAASLADLGVDSLARIELKEEMGAAFPTDIDDGFLLESTTVKDVLDFICPALNGSTMDSSDISTHPCPSHDPPVTTPLTPADLQRSSLNIDPVRILAEVDDLFPTSAERRGFTGYWDFAAPQVDQLMLAYIVEAYDRLGTGLSNIESYHLVPVFKSEPKHDQLLSRLWAILERFDLIRHEHGRYIRTTKPVPGAKSAHLYSDLVNMFPEFQVDIQLMAVTGSELASCLNGQADPLKLLFGTVKARQILSDFYHTSPMFATMTDQLLLFVKRILKHAGQETIHILEVGAGFGGTTTALAEVLQESGCNVKYTFTDVAPTLVDKARKTFARYSWMDFTPLDLEQDPPERLRGEHDIVIATNVVHATSNLAASTRRLRMLLRDGGFVCLSEITKIIEWHNLVFGLLAGWWCFNDGRDYALQSAEEWMAIFREAGFDAVSFSTGHSEEARSQQLLVGSMKPCSKESAPPSSARGAKGNHQIETIVYKRVDETDIHADIYWPKEPDTTRAMPVVLMIHGGGYMTLSKSAVRPAQTRYLLSNGILPISIDHRLCPEINIIDGPIFDVRDAITWAHSTLPGLARRHGVTVKTNKLAVMGWSTGGHLAMTTAWTTAEAGIERPSVILNFYGPSDFETLSSATDLGQQYPARSMSISQIRASLFPKPITSYHPDPARPSEAPRLGWLRAEDPRSELVLSLFKEPHALSLLLHGPAALLHDSAALPASASQERLDAINPLARVRAGEYTVPTFIVHGEDDDVVPCAMSVAFERALRDSGVRSGVRVVKGTGHLCDLGVEDPPGRRNNAWEEKGVGEGMRFLLRELGL